jgi:hypothetical protein
LRYDPFLKAAYIAIGTEKRGIVQSNIPVARNRRYCRAKLFTGFEAFIDQTQHVGSSRTSDLEIQVKAISSDIRKLCATIQILYAPRTTLP